MAHIRKLDTGSYQVRYRDPTNRERARNFPRKIDAERFMHTVEVDKLRGEWADPRLGRITFGEWNTEHQSTRNARRPSTRARDESVLANWVLPTFGDLRLSAIQSVTVRKWVAAITDAGKAPATVRKAYQLLAGALDAAERDGLIPRSPARDVTLPRVEQKEMRFLEVSEVADLAEAIAPRFRVLVLVAAYTGMRWGELGGLEVSKLDMLRRQVRVDQALTAVQGKAVMGPVKTAAARRTLSLPRFLVDELAGHMAAYPPDPLVFTSDRGGPLRGPHFRRHRWLPTVRASVGEPMRFHDLRHTHAALLIAQGEHPKVIQSRLGHASIKTTLDTYGHLFEGLDEAAADRLDETYRAASADSSRTLGGSRVLPLNS